MTDAPVHLDLNIVSTDGQDYRCADCNQKMVVAATARATWAEMGRRLQALRRKATMSPPPKRIRRRSARARTGQEAFTL